MDEFSIMPSGRCWSNRRFFGSHRHEVFFGSNRQKSIDYGLVVFLKPEMHNMSNHGVHYDREFDLELKKIGQEVWMRYYNKTLEDFIQEFGKSYL